MALRCSTDELLGMKPISDTLSSKTARHLKRLRRIEELPAADPPHVIACNISSDFKLN